MRQRTVTSALLLTLCFVILAFPSPFDPVIAGGPLMVNTNGIPYTWNNTRPISFTPDKGWLGSFPNSEAVALTRTLFQVWEQVPTASIRFQQAGELPFDVTGANVMEFLNSLSPGVNPIIFDTDGSVIEGLVGTGARLYAPGAATPVAVDPDSGMILQALAILNGVFIDGIDEPFRNPELPFSLYQATFIHEFGHFIGLDHSSLNTREAMDGDPANDSAIPTMFPQLASDEQGSLHLDDLAAVSTLYPTREYLATRAVIRGRVIYPDGMGFQGVSVIARSMTDPLHTAVSSVSGFLHTGSKRGPEFGSDDPALLGYYELSGLPPGTYTVEISQINQQFRGGSSVGPVSPPVSFPGIQFFAGYGQPASLNADGAVPISTQTGSIIEGIDIPVYGRILTVGRVQGPPGTLVEVPVFLSDPAQIGAMAFSMNFDPTVLALPETGALVRGPLVPARFTINAVRISQNQVLISISPPLTDLRATLNPFAGVALWVRFQIQPQVTAGATSQVDLANAFAINPSGEIINFIIQPGSVTVDLFTSP